jgi:hypothetical protein
MDVVPPETIQALALVGVIGGIAGLIGGFLGSKHRLLGSIMLGIIGGITAAAVARIAGATPGFDVGEGFSALYAAGGGFLLGYAVSRSTV